MNFCVLQMSSLQFSIWVLNSFHWIPNSFQLICYIFQWVFNSSQYFFLNVMLSFGASFVPLSKYNSWVTRVLVPWVRVRVFLFGFTDPTYILSILILKFRSTPKRRTSVPKLFSQVPPHFPYWTLEDSQCVSKNSYLLSLGFSDPLWVPPAFCWFI